MYCVPRTSVSAITYPTGISVQRNYNAYGYLKSVSNAATGAIIWKTNTMDIFGHITRESFGNGVVTTHTYDNLRGTLTGLTSTSGTTTIQNWAYSYDAIGNMKSRTNSVVGYTERYTYDKLNRVTRVYDGGNRLAKLYGYALLSDENHAHPKLN